jgi:PAS domain S-box-containing protein
MKLPDERQSRATGDSVRALLVSDPERLDDLAELFRRAFDDPVIVQETSADGGSTHLDQEAFDCLVVTDYLPETSCGSFVHDARDRHPNLPIVVVTDTERVTRRAVDAGATDVIRGLRTTPPELVVRRLEHALAAPVQRSDGAVGDESDTESRRGDRTPKADDGDSSDGTPEMRPERYRRYADDVLDAVDDVFYVLDRSGDLRRWNESLCAVTGYDDREIESMHATEFFDESEQAKIAEAIGEAFETGSVRVEAEMLTRSGEQIPYEFVATTLESPDGEPVVTGIGRDITERRDREAMLRDREIALREIHRIIADADTSFESKVESLLALGTDLLDTAYAGLSNVEGGEYRFVAVHAPDSTFENGDTLPLSETYCERIVSTERRLDFGNVLAERPDLAERGGFTEMGAKCYMGAPVTAADEFFGTLCFFGPDARERSFDEWEVTLVDLMSQWVSYELSRREHERDLNAKREHLAAINRLNRVIRNLNEALVETTSRETLEQEVCNHLAATDRYSFAWIGGVDRHQTTITPRAVAGDPDDYLEDVTITVDDSETGRGPSGTALKTGEVQIAQSIESDPKLEPWREAARERGFASSASIPITHDETTYGVLNVYSDQKNAFGERQRQILGQLGSIVGHAISALERKRALLSDTTVQLEFALGETPEPLAPIVESGVSSIEIERVIPLGDDRYVHFFRIDGAFDDEVCSALEQFDGVREVRTLDEDHDRPTIEVTIDDPPLTTALSAYDGRLRRATLDDSGFRIVAELPHEGDVRSLLEALRESFPDTQMLAQRTVTADEQSTGRLRTAIEEQLTDRQRVVLETAYFTGFYDWPRSTTGEQLAERLDISPATFTQHLRIAERKLLAELFETGDGDRA